MRGLFPDPRLNTRRLRLGKFGGGVKRGFSPPTDIAKFGRSPQLRRMAISPVSVKARMRES